MAKFAIGEIAILDGAQGKVNIERLNGHECEILSMLYDHDNPEVTELGYDVNIHGASATDFGWTGFFVIESVLKKKPPKFEPGSWDECVFKPKELVI